MVSIDDGAQLCPKTSWSPLVQSLGNWSCLPYPTRDSHRASQATIFISECPNCTK